MSLLHRFGVTSAQISAGNHQIPAMRHCSSDSSRAAGNKVRRKSASRIEGAGEAHNNNNNNEEPGRNGSTSGR